MLIPAIAREREDRKKKSDDFGFYRINQSLATMLDKQQVHWRLIEMDRRT
jgi:hypothetical protein